MSQKRFREPRKRLSGAHGFINEHVRRRFPDVFAVWALQDHPERFFIELPSSEERRAFAQEFRQEYLEMLRALGEHRDCPASYVCRSTDTCVFTRALEFFEGMRELPEMPDLRGVRYIDQFPLLAQARAEWWLKHRLPVTERERRWLREREATPEPERGNVTEMATPEPGKPAEPARKERHGTNYLPVK